MSAPQWQSPGDVGPPWGVPGALSAWLFLFLTDPGVEQVPRTESSFGF